MKRERRQDGRQAMQGVKFSSLRNDITGVNHEMSKDGLTENTSKDSNFMIAIDMKQMERNDTPMEFSKFR